MMKKSRNTISRYKRLHTEHLEERQLLTVTLQVFENSVNESPGGEEVKALLMRDGDLGSPLDVSLTSSNPTALWTPGSVTIPTGESSLEVTFETVNNPRDQENQVVNITVEAEGHESTPSMVVVQDDDTAESHTIGGRFSGGILTEGEYQVQASLSVHQNTELTIEPGSTLAFDINTKINVLGSLVALGQPDDIIHFNSAQVTPAANDWMGIRVTDGDIRLQYVDVGYATNGVEINDIGNGEVFARIEDSIIHDNATFGISVRTAEDNRISKDGVQIRNNEVYGNQTGIHVRATSSGCKRSTNASLISGNHVHSNETGIALFAGYENGCIPRSGSDVISIVTNNVIASNNVGMSASSSSWNGALGAVRGSFWNNLVIGNESNGISFSGSGSLFTAVVNNTIVNNGGAGVSHDARRMTIRNNIIGHNAIGIESTGVLDVSQGENNVTHNLFFQNSGGHFVNYPEWFGEESTVNRNGTAADVAMNLFRSPDFIGNGDYHLNRTSPAIDAGTNINNPDTDIDGNPRGTASRFGDTQADRGIQPIDIGYHEAIGQRTVTIGD